MALYIDRIDFRALRESLARCSDLAGEELKICMYRALSSSTQSASSECSPLIELCKEPFWLCLKSGSRRVYIVFNANLDTFFVVSSCFAKRSKSFLVASEEAHRYLGEAPSRICIGLPKRGVSISLRCRSELKPFRAIVKALSLASALACLGS